MAYDVNGSTELAAFSPTLVSLEAMDAMDDATENNMFNFSLDLSNQVQGAGALDIPIYPAVDLEEDVEGTALEGAQFPATKVTLTPDTKRAVIIPITDYGRAYANQDVMNGYGRQVGRDAIRKIDIGIAGVYADSDHAAVDAGAVTDIDEEDILAAKDLLDMANAPSTGRVLVVHPFQYNAILGIAGLTRFDAVGKADEANAKISGIIGRLHGFTVVMDQNMIQTGADATLRRHNIAFVYNPGDVQKCSIGWGMATFKPMVSNTLYAGDRLRLIWTYEETFGAEVIRGEISFGFVALRPEWIVDITTGVV
jgi:hypothetical protein